MNRPHHTIILMGLRASGKSTIGRLLADQTARTFVDLDDRTAKSLGAASAGEAIDQFGIDRFRQTEARVLVETIDETPGVLALGGGSPTAPGAEFTIRRASAGGARVIYLHAAPRELAARLLADQLNARPSLTGLAPIDEVKALYEQRDPLYRSLATRIIQVAGRPPQQVAAILRVFEAT